MHLLRLEVTIKQFNITPAAVNVLLVLHAELDHEGLLFVGKLGELGRKGVEMGVLGGFYSCGN